MFFYLKVILIPIIIGWYSFHPITKLIKLTIIIGIINKPNITLSLITAERLKLKIIDLIIIIIIAFLIKANRLKLLNNR